MTEDEESNEAERRLVAAAQAGDRTAFEQLVLRHKDSLYRFVRRYIGDADDAYDILQDCFVAAWLALRRVDTRRALSPWLRAIALNRCRDHARRSAVRRRLSRLLAYEHASSARHATEPALEVERLEELRLRRLDQSIAALPRLYKEALLLTMIGGLTHEQAARQLKTTPKAIEMRIRRAKQRLRQALSDLAPDSTVKRNG